jgi:hypothetical protein
MYVLIRQIPLAVIDGVTGISITAPKVRTIRLARHINTLLLVIDRSYNYFHPSVSSVVLPESFINLGQ